MDFETMMNFSLFQEVLKFPQIERDRIKAHYERMANSEGHKHWINHPVSFFKHTMLSGWGSSGMNCFKFILSINGYNTALEFDAIFGSFDYAHSRVAYKLLQDKFPA